MKMTQNIYARSTAALVSLVLSFNLIYAQSPLIYDGFTEPVADILVSGSELGRIEKINVKMGDYVQEGALLAQMDDSLQRVGLEIAKAQADNKGEIEIASAERDLHQVRTKKLRLLAKDGMARPDELERAETDLRLADARLTMAMEQKRLRLLEVKRSKLHLKRRRLTAPASGVIARILHAPGEYLTPADAVIFRLIVIHDLEAVFNIPVNEINQTQIGDTVQVYLQSQSNTVQGTVDRISPSIDGESGTIQIRVAIPNPDLVYRSGDRCTLQLVPREQRRTPNQHSIENRSAIAVPPVQNKFFSSSPSTKNVPTTILESAAKPKVKTQNSRQVIARSWLQSSKSLESPGNSQRR